MTRRVGEPAQRVLFIGSDVAFGAGVTGTNEEGRHPLELSDVCGKLAVVCGVLVLLGLDCQIQAKTGIPLGTATLALRQCQGGQVWQSPRSRFRIH
jgi:hypothetical protein